MLKIKQKDGKYYLQDTLEHENGAKHVATSQPFDKKGLVDHITAQIEAITEQKLSLRNQIIKLNKTIEELQDMAEGLQKKEDPPVEDDVVLEMN